MPGNASGVGVRCVVTALLLWVALGPAPPGVSAAGDDEWPKKARLKKSRPKVERSRLYELPRGVTEAEEPVAYGTKLGDKKVLFFDVDGNGSCGDVGVDAWVIDSPVYRYVLPMEESIMLDEWEVFLRFSDDGFWVQFRPEYPELPEADFGTTKGDLLHAKRVRQSLRVGLLNWNRLRLRSGLPPVRLDLELSAACMAHSRYMDEHGVTHVEDPAASGYTEAGARAGRVGSVGPAPLAKEIKFCNSAFYHRLMLFHPHTRRVGMGEGLARVTLDGVSGREERPWTWPVIIPSPGVHDVPRSMSDEKPIPHPETFESLARLKQAGFPITLTFETPKITDVTAELRVAGPEGAEVPFELSWPERPANESQPTNFKSICLIPIDTLDPSTTYWVQVHYTYRRAAETRTFRFRTGK